MKDARNRAPSKSVRTKRTQEQKRNGGKDTKQNTERERRGGGITSDLREMEQPRSPAEKNANTTRTRAHTHTPCPANHRSDKRPYPRQHRRRTCPGAGRQVARQKPQQPSGRSPQPPRAPPTPEAPRHAKKPRSDTRTKAEHELTVNTQPRCNHQATKDPKDQQPAQHNAGILSMLRGIQPPGDTRRCCRDLRLSMRRHRRHEVGEGTAERVRACGWGSLCCWLRTKCDVTRQNVDDAIVVRVLDTEVHAPMRSRILA